MKTYKELMEANKLNEERKTTQAELDAVNWGGFEAMIKSKTGASMKIKPKINSRGGVEYSSGNIVSKAGVMVGAFKELFIQNFNSGRMVNDTQLAIDAHFSWSLKTGGTNGAEIFVGWFDFNKKKWIFR